MRTPTKAPEELELLELDDELLLELEEELLLELEEELLLELEDELLLVLGSGLAGLVDSPPPQAVRAASNVIADAVFTLNTRVFIFASGAVKTNIAHLEEATLDYGKLRQAKWPKSHGMGD